MNLLQDRISISDNNQANNYITPRQKEKNKEEE